MSTSSVNDTARVVETLSDEELLAWLRLAFVFRGRAREAVQLVAAFGLPETIFELPRAAVKDRIGRGSTELFSDEAEVAAEKALTWLRRTPTADVVLVTDPLYPKELIASGTSDVLLFVRGRRETLARPRVTLLISAKADAEGRRNLKDFAAALAENGVTAVLAGETEAELTGVAAASQTPGGVIIAATAGPDRVPSALCLPVWKKAEQAGLILTGHFRERVRLTSDTKRGITSWPPCAADFWWWKPSAGIRFWTSCVVRRNWGGTLRRFRGPFIRRFIKAITC